MASDNQDLTPKQLSKLRQIFDAALERDPTAREKFVAETCEGDNVLCLEINHLLAAHELETGWIDRPLLDALPAQTPQMPVNASWIGRQVGVYRVISELGAGGMATVFFAERRIGQVSQAVALKIIRPVFTTNEKMMRRFEHEREILASLDHPNIARFLDIGATEDGIPYLVMDYVNGKRLDVYCAERALDIRGRLELFCTACGAIQYAHSKGVIHRDLKPSNILVTPEGSVRLLDFGIAKILRESDVTGTLLTETGAALMTVEYASPEQVRGDPMGPPSDVYSLGVVLFELLTGRHPHRIEGRLMHSIAQAICDEQPMNPSSAVKDPAATPRFSSSDAPTEQRKVGVSSTLSERSRSLAGDLDSILLKALRKEPRWRYRSADEFSADIRRHLDGVRVLARDDTFRYQLERVVRRLLYPSNAVFHTQGLMMFTAGLLGVGFLLERQQMLISQSGDVNVVLNLTLLALWFVWAIWQGRGMTRTGKLSSLDRQSWVVFTTITVVLGVLSLISELRLVIMPEAMAVFWNAGLAIGLFVIGIQASRVLTFGGIVLFASAVMASLVPSLEYALLAIGLVFGLVLPGFLLVIRSRR